MERGKRKEPRGKRKEEGETEPSKYGVVRKWQVKYEASRHDGDEEGDGDDMNMYESGRMRG